MAVTRYVNTASTSGGDGTTNATSGANRAYATLAAAITGTRTISDNILILATGGGDSTGVNLNSTNNTSLAIRGDGTYHLATSNYSATIITDQPSLTLDRLKVSRSGGGESFIIDGRFFRTTANLTIQNCEFWNTDTIGVDSGTHAISIANYSSTVIFRNNYIHDTKVSAVDMNTHGGESLYIHNNTIVDATGDGLTAGVGDSNALLRSTINNIIVGSSGSDYDVSGSPTTNTNTTNLSSDATSPNSGLRNKSVTFTTAPQFDSSQTDLIDTGTTIGAFSTDIYGTTRPQGSAWDLGCFELESSSVSEGSGTALLTLSANAVGESVRSGQGTALLTFSAEGLGQAIRYGQGEGLITFSAEAVGEAIRAGSGDALLLLSVNAVGEAVHEGSGTASITFSAEAVGEAVHEGAGTALLTFSAEAVGEAPVVVEAEGSGTASLTLSANAFGETIRSGYVEALLTLGAVGSGASTLVEHSYNLVLLIPDYFFNTELTETGNLRNAICGPKELPYKSESNISSATFTTNVSALAASRKSPQFVYMTRANRIFNYNDGGTAPINSIKVEGSSSSAFDADLWEQVFSNINKNNFSGRFKTDLFLQITNAPERNHWRVIINTDDFGAKIFNIPHLFFGQWFQFDVEPSTPFVMPFEKSINIKSTQRQFTLNFKGVTNARLKEFYKVIANYKDVNPVVLITLNWHSLLNNEKTVRCYLDDFSVSRETVNKNALTLTFKEDV